MTPAVRPALETDAPALEQILTGIIHHGGLTALTVEDIAPAVTSRISHYRENGAFVVAETDRIVGFQYLSPAQGRMAHVGDIATFADINLRQSGIGRAMFEATCEIARTRGFHKITAHIRADNTNGLPFMQSLASPTSGCGGRKP